MSEYSPEHQDLYRELGEDYLQRRMVGYWAEQPAGKVPQPRTIQTHGHYPGEAILDGPEEDSSGLPPGVDARYLIKGMRPISPTYPYDTLDGESSPRRITPATDAASEWFQNNFWATYNKTLEDSMQGASGRIAYAKGRRSRGGEHYRTWRDPWYCTRKNRDEKKKNLGARARTPYTVALPRDQHDDSFGDKNDFDDIPVRNVSGGGYGGGGGETRGPSTSLSPESSKYSML